MEINRKQILSSFLSILDNISDHEFQVRVWIQGNGPEATDYGETVDYFFDLCDSILKEYKNYGISKDQYRILIKFRNAFEVFADTHFNELEFIDSPEWATLMAQAKDILQTFNHTTKKRP